MNDYFTFDMLGTSAGMIAAVTLVVQYLKLPVDKVLKVPTRFIVWVIAFIFQVIYQISIVRDFSMAAFFLSFLNSFVVALASMGAYEITFAECDKIKCCETRDNTKGKCSGKK